VRTLSPSGAGPVTRPVIPSSHLFLWRRSGVGGGRGYNFKASRSNINASRSKTKASQCNAKASRGKHNMSSSGYQGEAPASGDESGELGVSSGPSPPAGRGVIPGATLSASGTGDAAPPSLLTPALLLRPCRDVFGDVPVPPEDMNTAERLQQSLTMRPDLAPSWARGQLRGFLTRLDCAALFSADRGTEETMHSTPRTSLGADQAPCSPGSVWATSFAGLPDCLIRDPAQTDDSIISTPFIRAPVEDAYPRWLAATESRVKAMASLPAYPNVLYVSIAGTYLRRLPILPLSSHANSERRARRRGFFISWNHQQIWLFPPVTRPQIFAAVRTCFVQMETPIGFTTGGSLVAYYARDEIYRSCRDAHSVTMDIWVTEYLEMACNRL